MLIGTSWQLRRPKPRCGTLKCLSNNIFVDLMAIINGDHQARQNPKLGGACIVVTLHSPSHTSYQLSLFTLIHCKSMIVLFFRVLLLCLKKLRKSKIISHFFLDFLSLLISCSIKRKPKKICFTCWSFPV